MDIIELLQAQAARVNALELRERRGYHAYLQGRGDHSETLDEHVARHASLARLGPPAAEHELPRLQGICPVPLPAGLLAFYRTVGGFHGGRRLQDAVIHAPVDLLHASEQPEGPWQALTSMGLVHMLRWAWGNDRFEFDPDSGEGLDQAGIDVLNTNYAVIGRRTLDDGEAHEFIYLDRGGRFGRLYFHQDAFDELLVDDLAPMVQRLRPAPDDFDAALRAFVAALAPPRDS